MTPIGPPGPDAGPERSYVEMIMGLPFSVHLRGRRDPAEAQAVASVWRDLRRADEMFSTYRTDSVVSRIRRGEIAPDDAPPEVREVMAWAAAARRRTAGHFDVYYAGPLDPAGIVKGWAAARATRHIDTLGADWYLNAGGDIAMRTVGGAIPWRIGIEDPTDTTRLLTVLSLSDGAVATSGRAHRGRHIVDPISGRDRTGVAQATVYGPDLVWADIFATALVASGPRPADWALPDGYECLLTTNDGRTLGSPGMQRLLAVSPWRHSSDVPSVGGAHVHPSITIGDRQ